MGERLRDAHRTLGHPDSLSLIFGRHITQHPQGKLPTVIEDMHRGNPVLGAPYGNGLAKPYVRDDRLLRPELATPNVLDYGVKKAVENLPRLRERAGAIIDRYLDAQPDILETFVDRGQLRPLRQPTVIKKGKKGKKARRIPALQLDHPRPLALLPALVRFAHLAGGWDFHHP